MKTNQTPATLARLKTTCQKELLRFFDLSLELEAAGPFAMPSPFASPQCPLPDAVWHEWIVQDPEGYRTLCLETIGAEIEHVERETQPSELAWISTYETRHGPLDEVWFRVATGELDTTARAAYLADYDQRRASGAEVPMASWKCTPGRKPVVRASWKCSPARGPRPRPGPAAARGVPAA